MENLSFLPTWVLAIVALGTGGLLGAFWSKVRGFFSSITSVAIAKATVGGNLGVCLRNDILIHGKTLQHFRGDLFRWNRVVSKGIDIPVLQATPGSDNSLFFYRGTIIFCKSTYSGEFDFAYDLKWVRGTFSLRRLLHKLTDVQRKQDVVASEDKELYVNRYYVSSMIGISNRPGSVVLTSDNEEKGKKKGGHPLGYNDSTIHASEWQNITGSEADLVNLRIPRDAELQKLALADNAKQTFEDIMYWHDNKQWFEDHNVTWKRGYALLGPPGTGKTSFIRAVSMYLDFPVFMFNLASMDNEEFVRFWQDATCSRPCSIVFEDWDAVFNGRENVSGGALTFNTILSCIDGVNEDSGVLVWITTNHSEALDSALCDPEQDDPTRPGRIDRIVHFDLANTQQRQQMALRMLSGVPDQLRDDTVAAGAEDTPAQFQNRCVNVAQHYLWETK